MQKSPLTQIKYLVFNIDFYEEREFLTAKRRRQIASYFFFSLRAHKGKKEHQVEIGLLAK